MQFPDNLEKPARTILTSEGSINRSSHVIKCLRNNKLRFMTVNEAELIMGFPKNWTFQIARGKQFFLLGNALVVGLIEKIGKEIKNIEK